MVSSMTGYAAVTREVAAGSIALELRSVNSRFLDVQFRITEELRSVEPGLRELAMASLARGKIDCRLGFTASPAAHGEAALSTEALERLARLARRVREAIPDAAPLRVADVLHWPGVLGDDARGAEALREAAVDAMRAALAELGASRAREGEKLGRMLRERVGKIRARLAELEPLVPQAIAAYEESLATKLREALGGDGRGAHPPGDRGVRRADRRRRGAFPARGAPRRGRARARGLAARSASASTS